MASLNYKHLHYFWVVAHEGSMTRAAERLDVAVQTIKGITRRPWGDREHTHAPWYEPFDQPVDIDRAVHWALGEPDVFLNTAGDVELLPLILDAATRFTTRPSEEEMQRAAAALGMEP